MQKNLIPMEWFVATLAALTIPLFVLANVPVWATYVYPTLIVGTISGVVFFTLALTIDPIIGLVALPNSLIAFGMTLGLLYLARIPIFALVPGIFFGFACFVGVALAARVSNIPALFVPWLYATGALLLGPPLAWVSVVMYLPSEAESQVPGEVQAPTSSVVVTAEKSLAAD